MFRLLVIAICVASFGTAYSAQLPPDAPTAAPGLRVPGTAIPYALDVYKGKPELVPIHHSVISVNDHRGANIAGGLAGSFFYHPKMTTELKGKHARVELHSTRPVFYLFLNKDPEESDDEGSDSLSPTLVLLHLTIVKDHRRVAKITSNAFGGHAKRRDGIIDINIEKLPGGWVRITPVDPLLPGEYAFSMIPHNQAFFEAVVYDFGVDPDAPEAKEAISAEPSTASTQEAVESTQKSSE